MATSQSDANPSGPQLRVLVDGNAFQVDRVTESSFTISGFPAGANPFPAIATGDDVGVEFIASSGAFQKRIPVAAVLREVRREDVVFDMPTMPQPLKAFLERGELRPDPPTMPQPTTPTTMQPVDAVRDPSATVLPPVPEIPPAETPMPPPAEAEAPAAPVVQVNMTNPPPTDAGAPPTMPPPTTSTTMEPADSSRASNVPVQVNVASQPAPEIPPPLPPVPANVITVEPEEQFFAVEEPDIDTPEPVEPEEIENYTPRRRTTRASEMMPIAAISTTRYVPPPAQAPRPRQAAPAQAYVPAAAPPVAYQAPPQGTQVQVNMPAYQQAPPQAYPQQAYPPQAYGAASTGLATMPTQPSTLAPYMEDEEEEDYEQGFIWKLLLYGLAAVALVAIFFFVIQVRGTIRSETAQIQGQFLQVRAPMEGIIDDFQVQDGDPVQAGQLLFTMNDGTLQARIEGDRMLLDGQRQAIAETERLLRQTGRSSEVVVDRTGQQYQVDIAQQRVEVARKRLDQAQQRLSTDRAEQGRVERLFSAGGATRGTLDAANDDLREAESEVSVRQSELQLAQRSLQEARAGGLSSRRVTTGGNNSSLQVTLARQRAEALEAEVRLKQSMDALDQARVTARNGGTVTSIVRAEGTPVKAGDTVLNIETQARPSVLAYFNFNEARLIQSDATAEVAFPALGETLPGRVTAIGRGALAGNDQRYQADEPLVPVRIVLNDEALPETLQSGMQADVRVNVAPYKRLW
ncbi:MAG: biotin/lipoyl-binding protein [Bacteroidota bacterium]